MAEKPPPSMIVVDDTIPQYYANVVRVTTSINDMTLLFGRARPIGLVGDAGTLDPVCSLQVSPVQAKSLYLLLRQQLRTYEEKWGQIPVAPDLAEKYGDSLDG